MLVPVVQALATGSLMSLTRVVLSAFPLFLDAAELTGGRLTFAACLAACLAGQYFRGRVLRVNFVFVG